MSEGRVYFIGAGPGAPDLITLRAIRVLERADVVVYAGSLVNRAILAWAREEAEVHDSSRMDLEEIVDLLAESARAGRTVARLHSGDISLYSAMGEQIEALKSRGIAYEVIPGVGSAAAAAAALRLELTRPGVTQTVIHARLGGRTPVPDREALSDLARHHASLVVYLSADRMEEVIEALRPSYGEEAPIAVVYKASWPEEQVLLGTLSDIGEKVRKAKIHRTALILVGKAVREARPQGPASRRDGGEPPGPGKERGRKGGPRSRLYDRSFRHGYRGTCLPACAGRRRHRQSGT